MHIDRDALIEGVRPSLLKELLRRREFDTPRAMVVLGLNEPEVTEVLQRLATSGWINWDQCVDDVDVWELGDAGRRLLATRLIKRFPVREGREVVQRVIEAARAVNSEKQRAKRITRMFLFGSVLSGRDDDLAGDVDLAIETANRAVSPEELERLRKIEVRGRDLSFYERLNWPERQLRRAITAVSPRISIHDTSDLEILGIEHRQVYAFDVTRDREVPFSPKLVAAEARTEVASETQRRPSRLSRPWPSAPSRKTCITVDDQDALRAQHLWSNGVSAKEIANRLRWNEAEVRAYLAVDRSPGPPPAVVSYTGLDSTIAPAIPAKRNCSILVRVSAGPGTFDGVEIEFLDRQYRQLGSAILRSRDRGIFYRHMRPDLTTHVPALLDAARIWRQRLKKSRGSLNAKAGLFVDPKDTIDIVESHGSMDFRPFGLPMKDALDRAWREPRLENDDERYLVAEIGSERPEFIYWKGRPWGPESRRRSLGVREAKELATLYESFWARWRHVLSGHAHYTLTMSASALAET